MYKKTVHNFMNYARTQPNCYMSFTCHLVFPAGCGVEFNIISLCYIDEKFGFNDGDDNNNNNLLLSHITEFRRMSADTKCTPLYLS
jgi:hypothetical protein